MTKMDLVEKIHKEQNVAKEELMRLSIKALRDMDLVVPDAKVDEASAPESAPTGDSVPESDRNDNVDPTHEAPKSEEPVVESSPKSVEGKQLVGVHPITGKPVYL